MKTKKLKLTMLFMALIMLSIFIFSFINPDVTEKETSQLSPAPNNGDKFQYGAILSLTDYPNYTNYDAIGLNLTHSYITQDSGQYPGNLNRHTPGDWISSNVHLFTPVSQYAAALQSEKNSMYAHNQTRFLWHRPKIEWLAYGQSSTYEAEQINTNDPLWFYSFNQSIGAKEKDDQYGGGNYVLHCSEPFSANPGYVLKYLKANTEQCKRGEGGGSESQWRCDSECDWLVKPRIRIPASFPQTNPDADVCKIYVINQDGTEKKSQVIKARNFQNINNAYDGRYMSEFYFSPTDTSAITFTGDLGDQWGLCARGNRTTETGYNTADIQVYWYDNCDMWIDYVKVENDVADGLFKGQHDDWIHDEAVVASYDPAVYKFYVEIIEFNNLPCIKYINDRLRAVNPQVDLVVDFDAAWGLLYHVPYQELHNYKQPEMALRQLYSSRRFFNHTCPMLSDEVKIL